MKAEHQPTLAVAMLTHQASPDIKEQLQTITQYADEIWLVDDFSQRFSQSELRRLSPKIHVLQRALNGNFSAQRNAIFEHVTSDWTFFLDSDEVGSEDFWKELKEAIRESSVDAVRVRRQEVFLGQTLKHGEAKQSVFIRGAKTHMGKGQWKRHVHEVWDVSTPNIRTIKTPILHYSATDLSQFIAKLNRYADIESEIRVPASWTRVLLETLTYPPGKFLYTVVVLQSWRDGWAGICHSFFMAYFSLIIRVMMYEKSRK